LGLERVRDEMSATAETILYVDDDAANLTVLEAVCAPELSIVTASSGREGLALLEKHEVAVLLVDQRMPGMTGVDVLERARALRPDTVRLLVTAYSDLGEAVAAINRGHVERYIRKPWEPEELRTHLRDALAMYRMRRRVAAMERRLVEVERVYALGVVAASVAHELRNPLGVLVPSLELSKGLALRLAEGVRSGRTQGLGEAAARLGELLGTAALVTDQMVEITRGMELGHRRTSGTRGCDLGEVARLTLRMLRAEAQFRAEVIAELDEVPLVAGSPAQVSQVMRNLVLNALQAFPRATPDVNRVIVRVRRDERGVALEVEDNGPGISEEAFARIFDPFFTTKEDGGTGLGLAISRRIVEELGGRLDVHTRVGVGTRFTVSLPLAPAPPAELAEPRPAP
jgi:signal transduction histidine kinase